MLFRRIITVVILIPLVMAAICYSDPLIFKGLILLVTFLALYEFYSVTLVDYSRLERGFGIVLGVIFNFFILFSRGGIAHTFVLLTGIIVLSFFFFLLRPPDSLKGVVHHLSLFSFGALYVGGLLSYVAFLRELPDGIFWVFLLLAMTWLNDTFAYFAGHWWGRRRLAPKISPGKTIEGFIGGFLGSAVGFVVFDSIFQNPCSWQQGVVLTFMVGIFGPMGDLAESLIKRSSGVKDSGSMIPGHGGMLDRIDAILFTAPVMYYFTKIFY
ncbi:MAG: hypothetical protein A3I75_01235 [Deltaproteobacteria bacterium RIFCSPLOWO2_02_FULL_50_16]|nr:MAG: hypothetical protein A2053_04310 [Deltaproteobacteria bacterium GWA2_50_8]OGQ26224.1 MAG: hypothetical protein A3B79_06490 [Deltaproteobacteria bacterium RIFCSPHIGHO2_02_FULL_50_15]OGQ58385.1 MAG: hypothetical protein A3I75_01235 [Deltaproteobacteria bacterium RIFCSPLOWO2_02_FULL_50_16]OGQ68699.1 MAG: hypothetical protein A3F89_04060 [Deltaproteobacteria bacterium RIFCSPLOWO2_12_FULL_50_11]